MSKERAFIVYDRARGFLFGDIHAMLLREDGCVLASHLCSDPGFAPGDLWINRPERQSQWPNLEVDLAPRKIEDFEKTHPDIFRLAFTKVDEEMSAEKIPDGNVHTMPTHGPEHVESKDCWCEPDLIEDYTASGGKKLYLHKELQ